MTRAFEKEFLQNIIWEDYDENEVEVVEDKLVDIDRWSTYHNLVFKYGGKYYQVVYDQGVIEYQEHLPFESAPALVECEVVEPVEETVIVYKPVK